ncbi:MerR family transcriptional regulator [Clostridiaceae bacterium NSJ-31]|uniref:MerR family transcriptional regulator n=1 Tax=Ligaoa zhengdingensis TaxID=2763658 RepID=A0A926E0A9_9FIRM|nr:MerR family transcriptional regulator [Ligaoa zhengdingensis]
MNNLNRRLTVGQLAGLHGINKRTLHYYDQIGLFSPAVKGENGYRYYTLDQMPDLELILAFRELGMSIEQTQAAIHCGAGAIEGILSDKIADIDAKIEHLRSMKRLLKAKQKLSSLSKTVTLNRIESVFCEEETFVLSEQIVGDMDENFYLAMGQLLQQERRYRLFNHEYGIMLHSEKVMAGRFEDYDRFYMKPVSGEGERLFVRPAGDYLRIVVKGNWDRLPLAYQKLRDHALNLSLHLAGYAYERGLNETLSSNMEESVTEILVRWVPSDSGAEATPAK